MDGVYDKVPVIQAFAAYRSAAESEKDLRISALESENALLRTGRQGSGSILAELTTEEGDALVDFVRGLRAEGWKPLTQEQPQ